MLDAKRAEVRSVDKLTKEDLDALISHEIQVLRIPYFVPQSTCREISSGLKSTGYHDYRNAPQVGRIGMSYFETARDPEIVDHYFRTALDNIDLLRSACAPYACP